MEVELSDEQIRKMCFSLWLVEILEKNKDAISDNEELVKGRIKLEKDTKEMLEELTPEQLDKVLEEYKAQNDSFEEQYGHNNNNV